MTMGVNCLLLFAALILPSISALHKEMHKHMSADELRHVFHVGHYSQVPEYQLVQLTHHISKRHVLASQISINSVAAGSSKKSAHDKLSKAEIDFKNVHKFSDLSWKLNHPPVAENNYFVQNKDVSSNDDKSDELFPEEDSYSNSHSEEFKSDTSKLRKFNSETITLGPKKSINQASASDKLNRKMEDTLSVDDKLEDGFHKIRFEAFGKPVVLKLKKTEGLFKKDGLKLFTVVGNDTQPHGVEFIEAEDMGDEADHIGETFQDEDNQAALVIRRDPEAGLLVEGSIGHDLVIKPLPSTLSPTSILPPSKVIPPDQDDEMFMDANQDDMVSIDTGLPIKRSKTVGQPKSTDDSDNNSTETIPNTTEHEMEVLYDEIPSEFSVTGRNKMDNVDAIIYDDDKAKEERRKRMGETEPSEKAFDLRKALIEALEGAKHVVYKRDVSRDSADELSDYAFMEPDRLQKRFQRRKRSSEGVEKRRSKREAPYVIYPEILVIVDYDGYRLHGGDNLQIKRYFVSFWNGVDLRYKLLKGPKIRISIAGIIIPRGRDATPYLERNRVGRDAIDSAAALTDMGKYLFREKRLPVYDIAVAVTKLDMCRRQYANDVCNRGTAGFAYVGGACVVNKRLEKVNSVAIIEDTGGFSGIIVAAHEVGHLLGAVHDGSPPPTYLGGPGAEKCRWEDGFIMSDLRHTEKGFRWSPCSVLSFHHFLNGDTATCLYNSPHEDESLPRVLPGKLLSLDAQCRKDRGTSACFKDERVCAQLFCFDAGSGYCVAYRPAAEGSPCGDGQYCINGRCVAEHENIIPDYSHHTPSYIRRDTSPYYGNDTIHRFDEYTTQAYGTYPGNPYQQTHYHYPSTGQSPPSLAQPQHTYYPSSPINRNYQYTTQSPYQFQTLPITRNGFSYNPYFSTTRNPYDFRNFQVYQYTAETKQIQYTVPSTTQSSSSTESTSTSTTSSTTSRTTTTSSPYFVRFSFSSTKNPYDFKEFATKRTSLKTSPKEFSTSSITSSTEKLNPSPIESSTEPSSSTTLSTVKPRFGFFSKLDFRNYFNRTTTKNPYDFDLSNYKEIPNNNIKRSYSIGSYYGSQNHPIANVASPNETLQADASSHPISNQKVVNLTLATGTKTSM